MNARFARLDETDRSPARLTIDGHTVAALEGDTLLVAILANGGHVGRADETGLARAGFCLMGACQDCWVWLTDGGRLRACSSPVAAGMEVCTNQPEGMWPVRQ